MALGLMPIVQLVVKSRDEFPKFLVLALLLLEFFVQYFLLMNDSVEFSCSVQTSLSCEDACNALNSMHYQGKFCCGPSVLVSYSIWNILLLRSWVVCGLAGPECLPSSEIFSLLLKISSKLSSDLAITGL